MADVFDYLSWRGDLSMLADPFNEVDNLVLSTLVYLDWQQAAPEAFDQPLTLAEAAERYQALHEQDKLTGQGSSFLRKNKRLLAMAAESRRFGQMQVMGYVQQLDRERAKQFAALTFVLEDESAYLAFRGTDDTIVGWKEDFNMAFMPQVPSQADAVHLSLIHI